MPDIFNVNLAGIINNALGGLVFDQILRKRVSTRSTTDATKQDVTTTDYPCKGFVDVFNDDYINTTTISVNDRKIVILGDSLPSGIVPQPGDQIVAESTTFSIVPAGVLRDPAGATYTCQAN